MTTKTSKTPLHVVVQKIQSREISEDEAAKFFIFEPNAKKPFDFNIRINTDTVDISNAPSAHALAGPLLHDAGIALQFKRIPTARKRISRFKRKPTLIAEGDSWFKLPDLHPIVPYTLIDFLGMKFPIVNLAHWGDTLADIISKGEYWPYTKGRTPVAQAKPKFSTRHITARESLTKKACNGLLQQNRP